MIGIACSLPPKEGIFLLDEEITKEQLYSMIHGDYHLTNYEPGRMDIFLNDNCGGGGWGEILGDLADELAPLYDNWNYNVHVQRGDIKEKPFDCFLQLSFKISNMLNA